MEDFINSQNIVVIISIIVYVVVFIIQKAQFAKQNEILNKYEKIFSLFNIDEIEKYVELQKKSMNLSLNNREVELKIVETDFKEFSFVIPREFENFTNWFKLFGTNLNVENINN